MISVIVPTRNRARTLQRVTPALDGGYEILFVDGASAVSGRRVHIREGERQAQALLRPGLARVALGLLDWRARLGTWSAR